MKPSHTEPPRCAARFLRPLGGESRTGGYVREITNALRAIGCNYEMSFAPLSRELRQERADHALIVGMSKNRHDRPRLLTLRRKRDECRKNDSDECENGSGHNAIGCAHQDRTYLFAIVADIMGEIDALSGATELPLYAIAVKGCADEVIVGIRHETNIGLTAETAT